jgi:hypothetical protein
MLKIIILGALLLIAAGCGPSQAELERQAREKQAAVDAAVAEALAKSRAAELQKRIEEERLEKERTVAAERAKASAEKELVERVGALRLAHAKGENARKLKQTEEVAAYIRERSNLNSYQRQERELELEVSEIKYDSMNRQAEQFHSLMVKIYSSNTFVDSVAESRLLERIKSGEVFDNIGGELKLVFPKAGIE